jgi:hypothetical protein
VAGVSESLRSFFENFLPRTQKEQLVGEYLIREHRNGRNLNDILQDAYVTNRLTHEQVLRVLERPEVVQALGHDAVQSEL